MSSVIRYRQYAADCVRQAQDEEAVEERTILLNVALAWLRLAQQIELRAEAMGLPTAPDHLDDESAAASVQHEMTF
jgi:hypothetical protein